jgi:branched-chain amino acid transport system ATP-binding protein
MRRGADSAAAKTGPLTVENVTAGYGSLTALNNVSVHVPEANVVAIVGPNGAGKSTLLRVVSGLLAPWSGHVRLGSVDVTRRRPEDRATLGICHVPEGRGIFPRLSVKENLTLQSSPREVQQNIAVAVEVFPILGQRLRQTAGTMSGGQQQMLALTRAYISGARFILLDEVSLGLAPILVDQIYEFIALLAARGPSLLLVEQYVNRALAVADEVYVMGGGEVKFHGKPSEIDEDELMRSYLGGETMSSS